ncbi:AEC family transporter [Brevibacillus choshinensis]|uniref:AEC family transporter n=1 Tax=Brevibacillus choshinensis TaxID=54911 RepID=A0ABX7FH90_BRECH|nr:AEC family transporter [Brevibacillus choshinensis]QRG65094.1 AEC family transporter [Brevibacillus choshinensis]
MDSFNSQFLSSVLIIALGYFLKRCSIIREKDGEALARIIFNITLPCLIITTFHSITLDASLLLLVVSGFLYGILAAILAYFAFRKENRKTKGMLGMMIPGFNVGLFAYPLVQGIWGEEGLAYFGMFDIGNALVVFGVSYLIGSYYSGDDGKLNFKQVIGKVSKSIPLITYLLIFVINLAHIPLPEMFLGITGTISKANMPLSLLLLGIYLNFSFDKRYQLHFWKVLGLRYVVGLAIGIACFLILPFEDMFKYTLLVGFILPMGVSVLAYSVEFKYDYKFVGMVSNTTILISFVLLWGISNMLL